MRGTKPLDTNDFNVYNSDLDSSTKKLKVFRFDDSYFHRFRYADGLFGTAHEKQLFTRGATDCSKLTASTASEVVCAAEYFEKNQEIVNGLMEAVGQQRSP